MAFDTSLLFSYFMPLVIFLLVFVVVYALLSKTKVLGDNKFAHLMISFIAAIISFITPSVIEFTKIVLPWIAAFIVCLLFIILVFAFTSKSLDDVLQSKFLAAAVIIVLLIIFVTASVKVFGPTMSPYMPGGEQEWTIFHPAVVGGLILLVVGAVVSWVLTKTK